MMSGHSRRTGGTILKKTRKERGWLKKTFKRAMDKELREHKSSFIVFYILRALVIVSLVRQIILDNYEGAFFCILTIVLLYVPCDDDGLAPMSAICFWKMLRSF